MNQSLPTLRILHTKFGLIWTTSWPDKKDLFLKLLIWKNRKFPYEKVSFFLGKLYKKFFLPYTFITLVIFHTKCGSLWTTPWLDKISIFLIIEKAEKSIFRIEIHFFSMKVRRTILFESESTYPENTPFQVWFDLNNFSTRQKKPIFKITYLKKSQISVRKTKFFPKQAIQKILFALHFHYTGDYPYLVWFSFNNSLTR